MYDLTNVALTYQQIHVSSSLRLLLVEKIREYLLGEPSFPLPGSGHF